ncbi:MAG: hypothetical protein ABI637_01450 [Gemmatimonadota bacterium]
MRLTFVALALGALSLPHTSRAQTTDTIRGGAACTMCRVEFKRLAVLGARGGEGEITSRPWWVARDGGGHYIVSGGLGETPIVFDARGRFVRRLGTLGDGPGEFRGPVMIRLGAGDSLYTFDFGQRRVSVLSPTFRYVRSFPVPQTLGDFLPARNGAIVANAPMRDAAHIGLPLHLIDSTGVASHSFGVARPLLLPTNKMSQEYRRLTPDGQGGFWSAFWTTRYRLEHWSSDGTLLQAIEREVPWYQPYTAVRPITRTSPPSPNINAIWIDSVGRLWTMVKVPAKDWLSGMSKVERTNEGVSHLSIVNSEAVYDMILEVIDTRRRRVVASQRIHGTFDWSPAPGLVEGYRETDDGSPTAEVWQVTLRSR